METVCAMDILTTSSVVQTTAIREVGQKCPMRFPCKSKGMVSIDILYYCDGIFHCDNHSDKTSNDCLKKRFNYAAAGGAISISKEFVCDGRLTATKVKMKVVNCQERKDFITKVVNQFQSLESLFKMVQKTAMKG